MIRNSLFALCKTAASHTRVITTPKLEFRSFDPQDLAVVVKQSTRRYQKRENRRDVDATQKYFSFQELKAKKSAWLHKVTDHKIKLIFLNLKLI